MKKENWTTDFLINLAKIYADDVDILEIIEDTINVYGEYKNIIEKMDKKRTRIHNSAIASTKVINRLCESNRITLFFEGNIEDRVEVAEFKF